MATEFIVGSRNKQRFTMYLAIAAAVSLWLIPIDLETLSFLNAPTVGAFVSTSMLIAIVLYEFQVDTLLDRYMKHTIDIRKGILEGTQRFSLPMMPEERKEIVNVLERYGLAIDALFEHPQITRILWETKLGISTGLVIVIASLRYVGVVEVWFLILGLFGGGITIIISLYKDSFRKLKDLATFISIFYSMKRVIHRFSDSVKVAPETKERGREIYQWWKDTEIQLQGGLLNIFRDSVLYEIPIFYHWSKDILL
ncbi:MAG: hypothetical protein ACW98Y_03955 [Candidatus Thorarchaeota archaeon]|jgi:hypothetical protein